MASGQTNMAVQFSWSSLLEEKQRMVQTGDNFVNLLAVNSENIVNPIMSEPRLQVPGKLPPSRAHSLFSSLKKIHYTYGNRSTHP